MRPIVTDVPWSVCVSVLHNRVSPTKTDEPIEMPFAAGFGWAQALNVGSHHILGGSPDPLGKRQFFGLAPPAMRRFVRII